MDFPPLSQELLLKALGNLDIQVFQDEDGVLGAEFPNAEAKFYLEENFLTVHTVWNQAIMPESQDEALELINAMNGRIPTGKVAPIVVEEAPTIDVRENFFAAHGLSELQLCQVLDAYFQIVFMIFDEFEQRGFAQNAQV